MKYEPARWLNSMGGQSARLTIITSLTNRLEFLIACSMADWWGWAAGGQAGLRRAAHAGVLAMNVRCGWAAAYCPHARASVGDYIRSLGASQMAGCGIIFYNYLNK